MVSTLVFSLTTAGLLFLVLGERLGLPAPLGVVALQALLALACGLMVLLSATNRLEPFLAERPSAQGFGRIARLVLLLFAGLASHSGLALENPAQAGILVLGFAFGTLLLLPREPGFGGDGLPLLAGGLFRRLAVAGLAMVLFVQWFPGIISGFAAILQRSETVVGVVLMLSLALGVAVGGAAGLSRLARAILLLALVFAALPLAGAAFSERSFPMESLRGTAIALLRDIPAMIHAGAWRETLPALLTGFAIGGLGSALRPPRESVLRTLSLATVALVIAATGSLIIMVEVVRLHSVVMEQVVGQPPARWPLFVFDETIFGWLRVCGEAPRDVLDAFRACRLRGFAGVFPPSEITLEPGLIGPAIAASRGLPVVLGAGWMLAAPLACVVALGLALHGAATVLSETVLYRRRGEKALRSTRLLLVRLLVLAPPLLLFALPPGMLLDAPLALWLMLGCLMLILVAWIADLVRLVVRRWQARMPRDNLPISPNAEAT